MNMTPSRQGIHCLIAPDRTIPRLAAGKTLSWLISERWLGERGYVTDIAVSARRIGVVNEFGPEGVVARISLASQPSISWQAFA
jgi:hypothetical protein